MLKIPNKKLHKISVKNLLYVVFYYNMKNDAAIIK